MYVDWINATVDWIYKPDPAAATPTPIPFTFAPIRLGKRRARLSARNECLQYAGRFLPRTFLSDSLHPIVLFMRSFARTFSAIIFLMPSADVFRSSHDSL